MPSWNDFEQGRGSKIQKATHWAVATGQVQLSPQVWLFSHIEAVQKDLWRLGNWSSSWCVITNPLFHVYFMTELNSRQEICKQSNVRVPDWTKIKPWLVKWFSVPFLQQLPRLRLGPFKLNLCPSRAMDLPRALLPELQRYQDTVRCVALSVEVPGHY